jgi:hypothetical protein
MLRVMNSGTTTCSGSEPLKTPKGFKCGRTIGLREMEMRAAPLATTAASMLTSGDDCAVAELVKVNVTTHAVPDAVPPDAAVNTSCPVDCVHAPLVPN